MAESSGLAFERLYPALINSSCVFDLRSRYDAQDAHTCPKKFSCGPEAYVKLRASEKHRIFSQRVGDYFETV
jgi:hypothetical protein